MAALPVSDTVFRFRAIRSARVPVEQDPEPMVQQQLARLRFFARHVGATGHRVLDWGCGSGFNCDWLKRVARAQEVAGFDLCPDAVTLARQAFPDIPFHVADACDPGLDLRAGDWDRILSCEVLEHVPDMPAFLANVRRHLAPGGVAFLSTPNRLVFSLGHEPSPVNKEHIKELTLAEFREVLAPHFARCEVYGQRFKDPALLRAWEEDVRHKIDQCRRGTRWAEAPALRSRLRRFRLVERAYQVPWLRGAWRAVRWRLGGWLRDRLCRPRSPYLWGDFEFVADDLSDSVWFCAVVRP